MWKLLEKTNSTTIVALYRDKDKLNTLPWATDPRVTLLQLSTISKPSDSVRQVLFSCDGGIYTASGLSNISSKLSKLLGFFNLISKSPVDEAGPVAFANSLAPNSRFVLCSSAGVTRPSWSDEKKARFVDCADIPIVRLNPFSILDIKMQAEDKIRDEVSDYTIVRPCGLNDEDHEPNSRPVFSQGDVAVGRVNRRDLATILVDVLLSKQAHKKTFEFSTIMSLPYPNSIEPQLASLREDGDEANDEVALQTTYNLCQQLLPGRTLRASRLAMGQKYEQLDENVEGRLGVRGAEKLPF